MLFQRDFTGDDIEDIIESFWKMNRQQDPAVVSYANQLFRGTVAMLPAIDALIQAHAKNWRLDRMATVDRNVMRLAVFEFLDEPETPKPVIINEALEIVKKFSTEESAQFVNGILDSIKNELISSQGEPHWPA